MQVLEDDLRADIRLRSTIRALNLWRRPLTARGGGIRQISLSLFVDTVVEDAAGDIEQDSVLASDTR